MELFGARDCIEYSGRVPRVPALNVTLHDLVTRAESQLLAAVDTGFAGYLLVRKGFYAQLATAELPAESFMEYSTINGPVALRKVRATVEREKLTLNAYIETPQHGPGRDLIGRRLLREINIALRQSRRMLPTAKRIR